ncbi:Inherit from COG: epimerase dehydratase [Seminavis robusta]|uniref:Inherit from COG: epimerase dehydratase n=1 Tax=Seminavis robusta TaxID=568900 RepID=A0A9N8HK94_9STRA|nr:Inherit from COG: epimerase dehydratase [Seminavis robusta]|eukprot:Sro819_g207060.1 Inherit from COG: epimerase dehydratase (296) ;mRNA; r:13932-14819
MISLPKAIVVGATGYIGQSTLSSLVSRHGDKLQIFAGSRDPSKVSMEGVESIKADMGDKDQLTNVLKGFDHVFLVIPGHHERTKLGLNGLEAAKAAGVKHVLLLSVLTAETDTIFGRQFKPLEDRAKEIGIGYTIIRLPLFMDNYYAHAQSIIDQDTFYVPHAADKKHTPVSVADAGKAAADILASPEKHTGQTYKLVSPSFSMNDVAAAFSWARRFPVKMTQVPYEAAKKAFMGMGFPEWQVDGIMELYKLVDEESSVTNEKKTGDIEHITGEKPMTIDQWVNMNKAGFGVMEC